MESGRRTYQLSRQPLAPIVDQALDALAPQLLQQPSAEVVREVASDLPAVMADREALAEAILNLLNNALKYTAPTDKRIVLSAVAGQAGLWIRVADNGPGIPGREQKRIFQKFYRGRDPLSRTIEGTGLGLAMVKHIVEAHGGRITVRSEVGQGASFAIWLPSASPSPAAAAARV